MSADKASIKWREDERVLIQQDNASWGKSNTENLVGIHQ